MSVTSDSVSVQKSTESRELVFPAASFTSNIESQTNTIKRHLLQYLQYLLHILSLVDKKRPFCTYHSAYK